MAIATNRSSRQMEELAPGRLAAWRVRGGSDQLRLEIDLGHDWGVTLTIDRAGHAIASLSEYCMESLAAEARQAPS
jgi:hypothetical protein